MTKVFISGDSWGCGEWQYSHISHKGLEQYFIDNRFHVINSSKINSSNNESIERLENSLEKNYQSEDLIFWFKTDTIRDLRPYDNITKELNTFGSVRNLINYLSDKSYNKLNNISSRYSNKINVIGGFSNIVMNDIKKYKNLNPIVPSMVDLLVGNSKDLNDTTKNFQGLTDWIMEYIDLTELKFEIAENVINELTDIHRFRKKIFQKPIFYPDGYHPNREGHRILFDYIFKELSKETI